VMVAGDDEIVWVAGVAVDERFAAGAGTADSEAVGLSATQRQQSR
jgi:hypothetical protein